MNVFIGFGTEQESWKDQSRAELDTIDAHWKILRQYICFASYTTFQVRIPHLSHTNSALSSFVMNEKYQSQLTV